MITIYAGLWYLTHDIGEETSTILFAIMLIVNTIFGVIWITAYLGRAGWAEKLVYCFRVEKTYIVSSPLIPFAPKGESDTLQTPMNKIQFLQ